MEGSFFYRTETAEIHRQKMHVTVLNRYPGDREGHGQGVRLEIENQLFRIFEKYDG